MTVGYISLEFVREVWNGNKSLGIICREVVFKIMRLDENNIQSNVDKYRFKNREIRSKY